MKIATRNLLAEMIVEALDDPVAAATLCRLAISCHTFDLGSASEHLRLPVVEEEYPAIVGRLHAFEAALAEWSDFTESIAEETSRGRALRKGVLLFNHRLFFEVHEVLETQWVRETGVEKQFFQGLIQIAVAFHHLENRNLRGALALLHDGLEKIAPRQPVFLGLELVEFVQGVESCRAELLKLGEARASEFRGEKIPQLRLVG